MPRTKKADRLQAFYAAECLIEAAKKINTAYRDPNNAKLEAAFEETKKAHTAYHESRWEAMRRHADLAAAMIVEAANDGPPTAHLSLEHKAILMDAYHCLKEAINI